MNVEYSDSPTYDGTSEGTNLHLTVGKYRRESIDNVFAMDPNYCKWLYNQKILIGGTAIEVWLSEHLPESPMFQMPWGKFKGKTLAEIHTVNPQYIDWLRNTDIVKKQKHIAQAIDQFKSSQ